MLLATYPSTDTTFDVSHSRAEQPAGARRGLAVRNSAARIVSKPDGDNFTPVGKADAAVPTRSSCWATVRRPYEACSARYGKKDARRFCHGPGRTSRVQRPLHQLLLHSSRLCDLRPFEAWLSGLLSGAAASDRLGRVISVKRSRRTARYGRVCGMPTLASGDLEGPWTDPRVRGVGTLRNMDVHCKES